MDVAAAVVTHWPGHPPAAQRRIVETAREIPADEVAWLCRQQSWTPEFARAYLAAEKVAGRAKERQEQATEVDALRRRVDALERKLPSERAEYKRDIKTVNHNFTVLFDFVYGKKDRPEGELSELGETIVGCVKRGRERLEARVDALEQRPILRYRGIFSEDEQYQLGDMVSHQGSVWHCNSTTLGARPNDGSGHFTLAVKAGRDARTPKEPVIR